MMDLVRQGSQLDWELGRRRAELARLERTLEEREAAMHAHADALADFERRYWQAFEGTYRELEELEAQIAEKASQWRPDDATKRRKAERLRGRVEARTAEVAPARPRPVAPKARPAEALRRAYRALSKLIHPDLAPDLAERQRREVLMAQANAAYASGDLEALDYLASGWELVQTPDSEDLEALIDRLMRQIAQTEERLERLAAEQAAAEQSELARLMRRAARAEQDGRDLFAKIAAELDEELAQARKRLKQLNRRLAKVARLAEAEDDAPREP